MADFWRTITNPFKKPAKTIGDFFAPVPDKVRVRDVARETPKATLDTLQDIGQSSFRGFASVASLITGKPFVPQGTFQKELYGTDKPITLTSFGRESRGADPEEKSEGALKVIDPTIGLFFGLADAIPGGSGAKKGVQQSIKSAKTLSKDAKVFKGFKDITTSVLDSLKGRSKVSKQFISDLTNAPQLKQAERNILRDALNEMPNEVPVQEFANKVKSRLLPLEMKATDDLDQQGYVFNTRELHELAEDNVFPNRYENISLPENERGDIASYFERIYESPIKTKAGGIHFDEEAYPNYFAHSRVEDLPDKTTRRVIEIQSDLFQRGRLENEKTGILTGRFNVGEKVSYDGKKYRISNTKLIDDARDMELTLGRGKNSIKVKASEIEPVSGIERLEPYRNTWWERIVREEIKTASKDGKNRLLFPTGETAMKIEGLGQGADIGWWRKIEPSKDANGGFKYTALDDLTPENMQVGDLVNNRGDESTGWIITEVSGDGKFKAIPEKMANLLEEKFGKPFREIKDVEGQQFFRNAEESFDISGKIDETNPIFRFYEKDVQRYLKRFGGKKVTDENGVTWFELAVPKSAKNAPVEAFGAVAGIEFDDDGEVHFDPYKAALGLGIIGGIKGAGKFNEFGKGGKKVPKSLKPMNETESLELLASQQDQSRFVLHASVVEEEKLISNLDSVFADLKGVEVSDLKTTFTEKDLEQARTHYEIAVDMIMDNPARKLSKYANKRTGELPEVTGQGTSEFARRGDDIVTELGFEDSEQARRAYEAYLEQKSELTRVQGNLGEIRTQIRLAKQRDVFVDQAKTVIARQVARDVKSLKNLVESAERSGYRKGISEGSKRLKSMVQRLKSRRSKITAVKKAFNLTDGQMKKIRGNQDPRFMDKTEFDTWLSELETKALGEQRWQEEKVIVDAIIKEKELEKTDNLRLALQLPPVKDMTLEQLFQFDEALSQFKRGDTFLGPRMIQTITNTDIGPVKTVREIRESLAEQVGVSNLELTNVAGKWGDKFLYDPALAEENPLYKYMVWEWTAKKVEADQKILLLKKEIDKLAFAARRSRKRGISDRLVPQDKLVFEYLETPTEEKDLMRSRMTGAEIKFAEFVEGLFRGYRDTLLEKQTLKRYRENYITHTSRSFFERWKDDGFIRAIGTYWQSLTEQRVDFDAIGNTGEVLGLEKFFKYALQREGGLVPSRNVARAVMTYARTFEKKQALDQIIPKIDAYTFSLQRNTNIKDPTGLNVDGRLRQFVRQWLNNKKGRRVEFVVSQGGKMDARLRALKLFISLKDLGFNVITGVASAGGATISNYVGLTTKAYAKGIKRALGKRGRAMALKYNGVVGEPVFDDIISASNDIGDTFQAGAFAILQDFVYRAKRQFFLGSLTNEEWRTGNVSAKRLADIKLKMAKFHPIDDMKSVIGSTPEAQFVGMYKSWAVPFLMTARTNLKKTVRAFKEAESLSGKAATLKTEEARQLMKLTVGGLGIYTFFHTVFEDDDADDDSFVAKLKQRFVRETASSLSALNPKTWLSIRPLDFAQELAEGIDLLIKLERYKTSGSDYEKGDLKGIKRIQRELTPSVFRQFKEVPSEKKASATNRSGSMTIDQLFRGSGGSVPAGSTSPMTADQLLELSN